MSRRVTERMRHPFVGGRSVLHRTFGEHAVRSSVRLLFYRKTPVAVRFLVRQGFPYTGNTSMKMMGSGRVRLGYNLMVEKKAQLPRVHKHLQARDTLDDD